MCSRWGFDPADLSIPTKLWQGTLDNFGSRPAMAQHLHDAISGSELTLTPVGHLSILTEHLEEILLAMK
jgi:hypothetical protein